MFDLNIYTNYYVNYIIEILRTGFVTSAGELVATMLTFILADFMQLMRQHVPPHDIVRRIIANSHHSISPSSNRGNSIVVTSQDGNLGEFKDVITSMVITDIQDTILYTTVMATFNIDVSSMLQVKGKLIRKGKRYDELSTSKLTQLESQYQHSLANGINDGDNTPDIENESHNSIQQAINRQLPSRPNRAIPNTPSTVTTNNQSSNELEKVITYTAEELELLGRKRVFQSYKVS